MRSIVITIIVAGLLFSSCKKEEITYNDTPEIEFISVSPSVVNEFIDDVEFTIKYLDGNGDLGENDPNVKNLFVVDQRINITHEYRISQLSPTGANIPIAGNLNISLSSVGITDGTMQQAATFAIYIVDRAGNASNTVVSSPITVKKP